MATATILDSVQTYDSNNITEVGYDVDVRDNGTMRIELRSCWQGSVTGKVWVANATPEIMAAARGESDDDSPDLETLVREWLPEHLEDARIIRSGYKVQ